MVLSKFRDNKMISTTFATAKIKYAFAKIKFAKAIFLIAFAFSPNK